MKTKLKFSLYAVALVAIAGFGAGCSTETNTQRNDILSWDGGYPLNVSKIPHSDSTNGTVTVPEEALAQKGYTDNSVTCHTEKSFLYDGAVKEGFKAIGSIFNALTAALVAGGENSSCGECQEMVPVCHERVIYTQHAVVTTRGPSYCY